MSEPDYDDAFRTVEDMFAGDADEGASNAPAQAKPYDDDEEDDEPTTARNFGDEDDDDEEEEEEEEEEEDEEEDQGRQRKRSKHRHRRDAAARYLDIEAEVEDEDEDEEEDEDFNADGFIETGPEEEDTGSTRRHHASLDNRRQFENEDQSPEEIAKGFMRRAAGRAAVKYNGDMNSIPQRLLMPDVHDANLWQVRVKAGREREIVFSLIRKSLDLQFTGRPLQILSAFQRDSLPGMIYVEARSSKQVLSACNGLVGVYPSRGVNLVPIDEMASLLQIKKQDLTVNPGSWVRIRRGRYQGDLAQVVDVTENGEDVGLKFIPRIDLNPKDDYDSKKRKKSGVAAGGARPPQRLFNPEEVAKVYGRQSVVTRKNAYIFGSDTFKDGFMEKDFKVSGLILDDVNPSLDEITQFSKRQDGESDLPVDLSVIADASRKAAVLVLQPGDHVEVFEGEQSGVQGVVEEIAGDVVTITVTGAEIEGQKIEIPARSLRKRFKPGDHVKVMAGKHADETGLVVSVADNVVTFLSDMSMQEISVFAKDLREAAEVGSSTNTVGNYELYDLVQLDQQTVGVIFKTERDSFRVLDQNSQVRLVQPHQISMRRDSTRSLAMDSDGHEIRKDDNMKEIDGENRKGRVLHVHQSFFAFLHNRDIPDNGGVFVTRARSLASVTPKSNIPKFGNADLSKMNPAVAGGGGMVGSGNMGRGPRDRLIGVRVVVIKGTQKGYVGTVKDVNGNACRVELNTGNKIITVDKEKLKKKNENGTTEPLETVYKRPPPGGMGPPNAYNGGSRTPNPYNNSGNKTPGWSRTPNPYAGNQTPAWNSSSRTPNPYADGGRTPAWNAGSKTPNPYADGGRTPAWNAGSKTPNPYNSGSSGGGGWGGQTPARNTSAGGWGDSTDGWGSNDAWGAPTPASAPTPGNYWGAPTPAAAPTPGVYNMETPNDIMRYNGSAVSAPTPAATGHYDSVMDSLEDDDSPYEPNQDWLLEFNKPEVMSRIRVTIQGTRPLNYLDGEYEGKTGRIQTTASPRENTMQTALIAFDSGEERAMQAQYILPLPPSQSGGDALVLYGKNKHKIGKVRDVSDSNVVISADGVHIELHSSRLAALA